MDLSSIFMKQLKVIQDAMPMPSTLSSLPSQSQNGGKKIVPKNPKTAKGEYKKKLASYTLEKIQRYSKDKGIKINKRVNGKLVNITKANLINKLANLKFK